MTNVIRDGDLSLLSGKVAVLGYGSQGHAHALNLHDSGVDVVVGLRDGSASWAQAEEAGLQAATTADAVRGAQVVSILLPDQVQPQVYERDVAPNLEPGAALLFAHGFNVLYGRVTELIRAAFETLVEAGYQPEVAYYECLHELKLIVDLIWEGGLAGMRHSISDTAEFGDLTRGPKVVDEHVRENMRGLLS